MPSKKVAPTFSITPLMPVLSLGIVLIFASRAPAGPVADPKIAAALKEVSSARIQANIEKLVSFGTRSTLSAQDPASVSTGRGIGAAREWIKSEFEQYSKGCGGCLEVKTDSFTEAPAVRFTEYREDFTRQHQNVRTEDGVEYGDLPEFVNFDYVAEVARLNAATLASLASGPAPPASVRLDASKLENDSTLTWEPARGATGYEIVWRATSAPEWERAQPVANVTRATVKLSKDNVIFAVRAVDNEGHRSLPVVPVPKR